MWVTQCTLKRKGSKLRNTSSKISGAITTLSLIKFYFCVIKLHCLLNKILTFLRAVYFLNEKNSDWGDYQVIYPGWMED